MIRTSDPLTTMARGQHLAPRPLPGPHRRSGLQALIGGLDVTGVTTNPTIFATALASSNAYDSEIAALLRTGYPPLTQSFMSWLGMWQPRLTSCGTVLMVESAISDLPEPDNPDTLQYLQDQIARRESYDMANVEPFEEE